MINDSEKLTAVGLGTSRIASLGGALRQADVDFLLSTALNAGIRVIDTANTYASGDAERMIGKAIDGKQDDFFIITKAGLPYVSMPVFLSPVNQVAKKILQKLGARPDYSKKNLIDQLHKSLKRLRVEAVDAFLLHEPGFENLEIHNEYCEALKLIKVKGLAKYVGVATDDIKVLELTSINCDIDIIETSFSVMQSNMPTFKKLGLCSKYNLIFNQVFKSVFSLSQDNVFLSILSEAGIAESEVPSILVTYIRERKLGKCTIIGTKNPKHLTANLSWLNKSLPKVLGNYLDDSFNF